MLDRLGVLAAIPYILSLRNDSLNGKIPYFAAISSATFGPISPRNSLPRSKSSVSSSASSIFLFFIESLKSPTGHVLSRWRLRWQQMPHVIYIESHLSSIDIRPSKRCTDGGQKVAADGRVDVRRLLAKAMDLGDGIEARRHGLSGIHAGRVHLGPS